MKVQQENPNAGISDVTLPFVTSAWDTAKATLESRGEIHQLAIFVNRDEASVMFVPSAGVPSKEEYARLLTLIALVQNNEMPETASPALKLVLKELTEAMMGEHELLRPDLVVHMSEAWMVSLDVKKPSAEEIERIHQEGVSTHPDRIEVVVIGWKTRDGENGHQVRKLNRDAEGKPSLGEYLMSEHMGQFSSRFLQNIFVTPVVPESKKH